jgi:hypothetical protein
MKQTLWLMLFWGAMIRPGLLSAQTNSGPADGNRIESLKVVAMTGADAGQEIDIAAQRTDKPTVFIFVQNDKWDRPVARFLATLDKELSNSRPDVAIAAIWLTDNVEQTKEYLPRAQQSLNLSLTTLAVYPGDKNGPPGWSINPGAHLTAIVAHDNRVTASFGFRSLNETNVSGVLEKLKAKP